MLKQILIDKGIVEENKYLDKYVEIVSNPTNNVKYEKHHIIPVAYYKMQNIDVDNSDSNIVQLSVYEHILAHYYACLCFNEPLKHKMIHAFCLMSKEDKSLLNSSEQVILEKLSHVSELRLMHNKLLSQRVFSEETLERMRPSWFKKGQTSPNKGKPCSEHTKQLLREHNLAHPSVMTEEGKQKLSIAHSHPKDEETRLKMKAYSNNRTPTHLKNLSIAATGKTHAYDGRKNRWWKKTDPLPEGWTWGWK